MTNAKTWPEFNMRGTEINRVETFVAAAFAFAVTMLVISVGSIPTSFAELYIATKNIPAFAASFAVIVWIWHTHAIWCRRYGLEDIMTVVLSSLLVFLVLIYIYPLRLMMQGLFSVLTDGFVPSMVGFQSWWEARFMFAFYAIGLLLLSLNFIALYYYSLRKKHSLKLNQYESMDTKIAVVEWCAVGSVAIVSFCLALWLPAKWLSWAGYANFLLFPVLRMLSNYHSKQRQNLLNVEQKTSDPTHTL